MVESSEPYTNIRRKEPWQDQLRASNYELAYFDGLTYKQVASVLGIPEGTAKSRLRLAIARLRTLLGDEARTALR